MSACLYSASMSSSFDHCVGNNYDIFTNLAFGFGHTNHYQSFDSSSGCLWVRAHTHVCARVHARVCTCSGVWQPSHFLELQSGKKRLCGTAALINFQRYWKHARCWKQFSESIVGNFGTWHRGLLQTLRSWEEKEKSLTQSNREILINVLFLEEKKIAN